MSDYEKKVLKHLSGVDPTELITVSKFISDELFSIDSGLALAFLPKQEVAILYLRGKKEESSNRQRLAEILELLSLIEYLRAERYIHSIRFSAKESLFIMCKDFDDISQNRESEIVLNKAGYHIKPTDPGWIYDSHGTKQFEGLVFKKHESSIYDVVSSFVSSPLVPTPELKEFVANGYRTKEEMRYARSIFYTRVALGVAIFFGAISTFIGLLSLCVPG
ncbi:MAG: hypothetical protein U5R46_19875 [Gammaproteobacteria bacterium]|nr:hypothetical protein [Gammaproteobacteria bacterium]